MLATPMLTLLLRHLTLIAFVGLWPIGDSPVLTKSLLLQLVDGELSSIESMTCEYEISVKLDGQFVDSPKSRDLDGPIYTFYGHLDWVNSGEFHLSSSKVDNRLGVRSLDETSFSKGITTSYSKNMEAPYGFAEIWATSPIGYDWEYTFFDFFPLFSLRANLQREESDLVDEGPGVGSDGDLRIVNVIFYRGLPSGTGRSMRLWISLDGGIRVRRTELHEGKSLICVIDYPQFQAFNSVDSSIWLPVRAEKKSFLSFDPKAGKVLYLDRPKATCDFNLIRDKVKIKDNQIMKRIPLHLPKGTRVDDRVKRRVYEEGQDLRRPPRGSKEYDERLREYINLANTAENGTKAVSVARAGTPWSYWISGTAAVVLILLVAWLAYDRTMRS